MTTLDPWGAVKIENYSKLFEEFGISRFDELLEKIPNPHRYMRRHVIFGHRSYESVLEAMLSKKPFAALSGFMPSGKVHLGHKMVMEEIIWHQQQGGDAFLAIADMEAHSVRGISWEKCRELGINDYILSAIALGFEPSGHIYFQSGSNLVKNLAFELGIKANFSEMSAIYGFNGETNISHMLSALTQSADILHPQLKDFGGPKPVVIPVGADQDPHIRLTRGLADKMNKFHVFKSSPKFNLKFKGMIHIYSKLPTADIMKTEHEFDILEKHLLQEKIVSKKGIAWDDKDDSYNRYTGHIEIACVKSSPEDLFPKVEELATKVEIELEGYAFKPPASTYHMFMTGLQGGKMSSSIPESYIALTDSPEEGAKKVMRAKTGGRVTLEEQRRLGGQPEECSVYELLLFHLVEDDKELYEEIRDTCVGGSRVCGECKKDAAERMCKFLKEHQEKREQARERLGEFGLQIT